MAVRLIALLVVALVCGGCSDPAAVEEDNVAEVGDLRNEFAKAVEAGDADAVAALLKEQPLLVNEPNVLNNMPPLHIAASTGNGAMVKLLLDNGANKAAMNDEGSTAYDMAAAKGASQNVLDMLKP